MEDINKGNYVGKSRNYRSSNRHYCCVCSNYRGKSVNDVITTLHRFPANKLLQNAWLKRIRTVSSTFVFNGRDDRLCSAHFIDGVYDRKSKENNVPSIFVLQDGRVKQFEATSLVHDVTLAEIVEDIADEPCDKDMEEENFSNTPFLSNSSVEFVSVHFHDYLPSIPDQATFTDTLDKETQTISNGMCCSTQTDISYDVPEIKSMRTFGTQTDFQITCEIGIQAQKPDITIEDIKNSEMCMFYTGLPNVDTFNLIFNELDDAEANTHRNHGNREKQGRPRRLRLIDEFFLVLLRLRLGLLLEDLARRFHVSKSTCSNITSQWIAYLSIKLSSLVAWPSKSTIMDTMPRKFKRKYPNCRVIIDCTEFYTETPQSLANKSLMYSHYKSHMTWKALLGISPSGIITFVSDLWTGSISDKQITMKCGLLDFCQAGDAIMADKGFLISDLTAPRGMHLIIPPLKMQRFNRRQVEETILPDA